MRKRIPLHVRFWQKVQVTGGCWLWLAAKDPRGYGNLWQTKPERKCLRAHRISWELHFGPIPEGMFVCHACDNPSCVRPDHLFLGTCKDNMQDASEKGRLLNRPNPVMLGVENPNAKITERDALAIIKSNKSSNELADIFGLSTRHINQIRSGRRWKHLHKDPEGKLTEHLEVA